MTEIDLNPILNGIVWPALGAVVSTVAGVIAFQIKKKWGMQIDTATVDHALQMGLQKAQAAVASSNIADLRIRNGIVADTAGYVVSHAPDALKAMGVDITTPAGQLNLKEKIEARLAPAILAGASTTADMSVGAAATIVNPAISTEPIPMDAKP